MGAAPGIAGSRTPEAEGVFLCADELEAGMFVQMNNTGGPVDVWAVTGIDEEQMIDNGNGYLYFPGRIPPGQVTLVEGSSVDASPANGRAQKRQRKPPRARRHRPQR